MPRTLSPSLASAALALSLLATAKLASAQVGGQVPTPVATACATITRTSQTRITAARRAARVPQDRYVSGVGNRGIGSCTARGSGAWALTAEELAVAPRAPPNPILTGRWVLSFISSDGVVHRANAQWLTDAFGARFGEDAGRDISLTLAVDDLDNDGLPEAIVTRFSRVRWQPELSEVRVVTWRDGAAAPYVAAASFEGVVEAVDVDHDGALDLTWEARFSPDNATCAQSLWGPVLTAIAHNTRRGGFSRDDDTARAWLRSQCPFAPAQLLARSTEDNQVDTAETFRRVACARVWGVSVEEITRRARSELTAQTSDACLTTANLTSFAQSLPPWMTLPPAPAPFAPRASGATASHPSTVARMDPPTFVAASTLAAPLSAGCAGVERAYAMWLRRIRQARARAGYDTQSLDEFFEELGPSRGCFTAPGGAWAFMLGGVRVDPVHTLVASWSIRFFGANGGAWSLRERPGFDRTLAKIAGAFDYDGDGRGEAIVEPTVWGTDTFEGRGQWHMYTARGASVMRYAPAVAVEPFTGVADVDLDGRPDLIDDQTLSTPAGCGPDGGTLDGPTLVIHSLPDGSFSRDDRIARAFAARQCPSPPAGLTSIDGEDGLAQAWFDVTCARLWGASAESVVQALVVALQRPGSRLTDTCESFRTLTRAATQHPPLRLTTADVSAPPTR